MIPFRIVVVGAPVSVATKLTEDTMTYLNQGQAYEIKLENITDVEKKGFMCSIINIGFHERHMQQAEHELWQQWSQQHPDEKIFSVDMKLSYNVFGVESDGLNKCEFLWDSSKAAGVFIRINSISTEFTPRKHGGEKGVPFKLAIETFSYNSKTHDSYFISAACCQIKVFKPKGAERKIRSDREKISKKPLSEQDKYHKPSDHTLLKECSLTSLHPMADGSLCYYRHSHGHFASKQSVTANNSMSCTPNQQVQANSSSQHNVDEDLEHDNNNGGGGGARTDQDQSPEHQRSCRSGNGSETGNENQGGGRTSGGHHQQQQQQQQQQRDSAGHGPYQPQLSSRGNLALSGVKHHQHLSDYSASRLMQTGGGSATSSNNHHHHHTYGRSNLDNQNPAHHNDQHGQDGAGNHHNSSSSSNEPHPAAAGGCFGPNELPSSLHHHSHQQPSASTAFNQMYHSSSQVRGVASLVGTINNSAAHFGHLGTYYGHSLPNSIAPAPPSAYAAAAAANNVAAAAHLTTIAQTHHGGHQFSPSQSQLIGGGSKGGASCSSSASILRQFSHEKQLSTATTVSSNNNNNGSNHHFLAHNSSSSTPFKASNLALTHTHHQQNSFYLGNHQGAQDPHHSCNDDQTPPHDLVKEASSPIENGAGGASVGLLSYQHENQYDLHLHHSSSSSNSQQQQPFRQRSASTSLTITNLHCSNYLSHGTAPSNQASRHLSDAYVPTSSLFENSMSNTSMTTNHWVHAPSQGGGGLGSSSSICNQNSGSRTNGGPNNGGNSPDSVMATHHHHHSHHDSNHHNHHHPYASGHSNGNNNNNYECSDPNYDSDQNSPQKNSNSHHNHHHHHNTHHNNNNNTTASESASSCYSSRFKNNNNNHHSSTNSLMACQETSDQQQFESNSRIGSQSQQQQHLHLQHTQHHQQHQQDTTHITVNSNCTEVAAWFGANRFDLYTKTFANFSGSDLLRLSKTELIEICGLIDGIRLYNSLHNQPIKPGRVFYICHTDSDIFHPIYLYDVTLKELLKELSIVFNSHFLNCDTHNDNDNNDDNNNDNNNNNNKRSRGLRDKQSALNSSSSNDSGSSMDDLSTEIGTDDVCDFFDDDGFQRRPPQQPSLRSKRAMKTIPSETNNAVQQQVVSIDRLLIDGVTSVKIVATEQVVQMLENESVWTLSLAFKNSGLVEACMCAQFKRNCK